MESNIQIKSNTHCKSDRLYSCGSWIVILFEIMRVLKIAQAIL